MEYMHYVGYGMWGLLGFMVFGIVVGMIFGMARGTRRTLKRMIVLIPFLVASVFLAPLISRWLLLSPLSDTLQGAIEGLLEDDFRWIVVVLQNAGLVHFILSLPLIIINFIIFYILVGFFRYIFTPILSAIALRKIAPKRDKEGNKIKHSKLAGLAVGALFGCIIFAFMFIPVTGLMASLDRMDKYEPVIHAAAPVSMTNTGIREVDTANKYIAEVNTEVNKSVPGIIVGNPINKFFGDFACGQLTTIRANGVTANMQREMETAFELARDAIVIVDYVTNINNPREDMVPVFSDQRNMEYFESVVEKVFRLRSLTIVLDADLATLVEGLDGELNLLGGIAEFVGDDEEVQERFRQAIYKAIGNLNSQFFKEEILSGLEVMRLVFAEHKINTTTNVSLWERIDDVIEVVARDGKLDNYDFGNVMRGLLEVLTNKHADWDGLTLTEQIVDTIGNMNVFTNLIFDDDNTDLYQLPIMALLDDFNFGFLVGDDEAMQNRFRNALYDGLWGIDMEFFRDDIGAVVEVISLVFAQHQVTAVPASKVSLFEVAFDAFDIMSKRGANPTTVGTVSDKLNAVLTFKDPAWDGKNLAEKIFGTIGGMNIFENFLFDASNPDIHSMPIAKLIKMEPEDAIIDFNRVMGGMANILTRVTEIGSTIYQIVDIGNDIGAVANFLADNEGSIVALGEILEILTNKGAGPNGVISDDKTQTLGVSHIVRHYLADVVKGFLSGDGDEEPGGSGISFDSILGPLLDRLAPDGGDIAWADELKAIVDVFKIIGPLLSGDINPEDLIKALLGKDNNLFDTIAESELLSGIIMKVLESTINDVLDDTDVGVKFNFDGVEDPGAVIKAMGTLVDTGVDIVDWMSNDFETTDFSNLGEVIDLLGGEGDGDDNVIIQLFKAGVVIETDPELGLEDSINSYAPGPFKDALKGLFGF